MSQFKKYAPSLQIVLLAWTFIASAERFPPNLPLPKPNERITSENAMKFPMFQIVAGLFRIGWDRPEPYYGTAFQFEVDSTYNYLLADFHTLPRDRKKWKSLFVHTPGDKPGTTHKMPFDVIGIAPGYDVAVLRVKTALRPEDEWNAQEVLAGQKEIDNLFMQEPVVGKSWRLAITGTSSAAGGLTPSLVRFLWDEEAAFIGSAKNVDLIKPNMTNEDLLQNWRASNKLHKIELSHDCQPNFVTECFKIPMRTAGYSGGALLVAPPENGHLVKIAGIVWGYSPLSRVTYVLPWSSVKERATNLVRLYKAGGSQKLIELTEDDAHLFAYVSNNEVQVKADSALVAKHISRRALGDNSILGGGESSGGGGESSGGGGESSGGGGESSGGGGESSGGGGESSGGGGESSGGGGVGGPLFTKYPLPWIKEDLRNDIFGVIDVSKMNEEISDASKWGSWLPNLNRLTQSLEPFRGVRALLSYQTGVVIEGQQYQRFDSKPLTNLASFVSAFRANPKGELQKDFLKRVFPEKLKWNAGADSSRYGLIVQSSIHTIPGAALPKVLAAANASKLFLAEERKSMAMVKQMNDQLKRDDLSWLFYRPDLNSMAGSLPSATLEQTNTGFKVEFYSPRFKEIGAGNFSFVSEKPFEQQGDYFLRYAGPVTYHAPAFYPLGKALKSIKIEVMASLQYLEEEKRYELKLFVFGKLPQEWNEMANFYPEVNALTKLIDPNSSYFLQSIFIPLAP